MSEPCIYDKLSESIDILRQSGYRYGMSEREIERFIKQVLETNEPRREPPQFPILRATIKVRLMTRTLFSPAVISSRVILSTICICDVPLSVANTPVFSAVCDGGGFPVGHGAGLHIPSERPPVRAGQPGNVQLVIAAQPRSPSVTTYCQEVQPPRFGALPLDLLSSETLPQTPISDVRMNTQL